MMICFCKDWVNDLGVRDFLAPGCLLGDLSSSAAKADLGLLRGDKFDFLQD